MDDFQFKTTWASSKVRVVTPTEYCSQLSVASLADLTKVLPQGIDIEGNPDLLWNAFNAAVANRINANDDGIDTSTALEISPKFIHKFMDLEHDRKQIVGTILSQGYSTFGDNQLMGAETIGSTKKPFNLTLGGVVWHLANPDFADELIESSDPTSPRYNTVSASWELGFNKFHLLLGHKDVEQGELVSDDKQVAELKKHLRAYGGSGRTPDNVPVYRLIVGGLPLGIGYTSSPAADVEGVVVKTEDSLAALATALPQLADELKATLEEVQNASAQFVKDNLSVDEVIKRTRDAITLARQTAVELSSANTELQNTFSQTQTPTVKDNSNMEIKSLSDITDDALKQVKAATVIEFIQSELKKSNDLYVAKVTEKENEVKNLATQVSAFEQKLKDATDAVTKTNEELVKVQQAQAQELADRAFNERMASINERFTLEEKLSAIVAKEINGLNEEAFKAWLEKFEILAASKLKQQTSTASVAQANADAAAAAAAALSTVTAPAVSAAPANAGGASEKTVIQKFAEAFSGDAIKIK